MINKKNSTDEQKENEVQSDNTIEKLAKIILKNDKSVTRKKGKIMGVEGDAFYYEEIFKYALAKTKTGYTFHSMAMYANPDLFNDLKSKMVKAKFQKGCVNFKSLDDFPVDLFEEHMKMSGKCDFSKVIEHYRKVKKKR